MNFSVPKLIFCGVLSFYIKTAKKNVEDILFNWLLNNLCYNKHPLIRTHGLRSTWQKFAALIPQNTRICVAKQDQTGS